MPCSFISNLKQVQLTEKDSFSPPPSCQNAIYHYMQLPLTSNSVYAVGPTISVPFLTIPPLQLSSATISDTQIPVFQSSIQLQLPLSYSKAHLAPSALPKLLNPYCQHASKIACYCNKVQIRMLHPPCTSETAQFAVISTTLDAQCQSVATFIPVAISAQPAHTFPLSNYDLLLVLNQRKKP